MTVKYIPTSQKFNVLCLGFYHSKEMKQWAADLSGSETLSI